MGITKVYLSTLEAYDKVNDSYLIRLLEMKVDAIVPQTGYSLQFWKDVRLYGVDEAIRYLKDVVNEKQYVELTEFWTKEKENVCPHIFNTDPLSNAIVDMLGLNQELDIIKITIELNMSCLTTVTIVTRLPETSILDTTKFNIKLEPLS